MKIKVIAIPALALAASLSLAACGTTTHTVILKAAPAVTHTVTAPAPKPTPVKTTPAPVKTVIVQPAPAKTVYVQAPAPPVQHAGNGLACGSGVSEAGTNCSFALDVEQAYHAGGYWYQPGTSYLTVDGQSLVSASVGNPVVISGADMLVQFNY